MRDLKNKLTSGKNTKNIKDKKGKSFGYQVLGFGAVGAAGSSPVDADFLVIAGGGGGGVGRGGGAGAGGFRTSFPGGTKITLDPGTYDITVGAGGSGAPSQDALGSNGSNSVFSTITSAGGGHGGSGPPASQPNMSGNNGGSGSSWWNRKYTSS